MIHPRAVKEFLAAQRDTHVWVKNLDEAALDRALADIGFKSISDKPLDIHQKAAILLGIAYPRFSYWMDMGTGKTRVVLELLNHWWAQGILKRALVLAISDDAIGGWEDEIQKWSFKVPFVGIGSSSTDEKWQAVAEMGAGVVITTYAGFNWMFSKKVKVVNKRTKKSKIVMKLIDKKVDSFAKNLQAFVPDESVHLGNHRSLGFKIAKRISAQCHAVYALAGVPFGRDPTLMWSQQYLVDRGESLGETLGIFRAAFFTEKPGYFGGYEYKFIENMKPQLTRLMQHRSISYTAGECHDLPEVTPILRVSKLPKNTKAYFDKAMETLRNARGDKKLIENTFLRMRQLSSGFLGYKDDETGEKAQIEFPENPKLDDLMNAIEAMPYDTKFCVFYEYTWSGRRIMAELEHRKIKAGWLWSGQKDGRALKKRFDNDDPKKMKGLVINHFLGAESLNLQRANYLHFYESPVGVIQRKQAEKRTFRPGQTRPGFMLDYVSTSTDRRILEFHKSGASLFKALIRDPYKALGGR